MFRKKLLALLLAVSMAVTMLGAAAFAEDASQGQTGWNASQTMYYKNGIALRGLQKLNGKLYFFDESSGVAKQGFFYDNSGFEYYAVNKSGQLATGWQALYYNKKLNAYYFSKSTGRMAKGTTVGYLNIPSSGRLHEAYARGIQVLNKRGWTLRAAYTYSYQLKYWDRWWRVKGANKSERYAMRGFTKGKGNCFVMASTFYIMAKLLGYNIRQVQGKVGWRGAPHSWTEIKKKGKKRVYDPNFRNETGRNGWKIYYGKKGTWRYHKKKFYLNKFQKLGSFR